MESTPFVFITSFVRKSINETAADSNTLGFKYEIDNSRLKIECNEDNDQSCKSEDALIEIDDDAPMITESVAQSMQCSWNFLTDSFPWAMFLGEGAFKRVYKVWNNKTNVEDVSRSCILCCHASSCFTKW